MRKIDLDNFQIARSETARDINRRIVLNLIRKNQPVSRASLARQSNLQRSTVSAITEQLISERWVSEGALGHVARGRKPTFLNLNTDRSGIIGVDIRPSKTHVAVASLAASFVAQESIPTGSDPVEFIARLALQFLGWKFIVGFICNDFILTGIQEKAIAAIKVSNCFAF